VKLAWLILLAPFLFPQDTQKVQPELIAIAAAKGIKAIGSNPEGMFLYSFTRNGERRESLLLLPGAVFQADVQNVQSPACVSLAAAMPFNLGDGAVLRISVGDELRQQEAVLLSLDPAHVRAHRAWVPVRFEIPAGLNRVRLRFEVDPGIRGDHTADWVGLAAGNEPECLFGAAKK
jgi:hypothetical protein